MADFHNMLRILVSLDYPDLTAAGVIARDDLKSWNSFRTDPFRWFIRADDETARKLWTVIQNRHEWRKRNLRPGTVTDGKLIAPWTAEQVDALNRFQRSILVHPFTCPGHEGGGDRDLVATRKGWVCRHCDYTQDWAHAVMLNVPADVRQYHERHLWRLRLSVQAVLHEIDAARGGKIGSDGILDPLHPICVLAEDLRAALEKA